MNGHGGGLHDPAVHKRDFRRGRAMDIHRHAHRAFTDHRPILAVDSSFGINGIVPFIHRGIRVIRDGCIVFIHIMNGHGGRLYDPAVHKRDFRRGRAVSCHKHAHRAFADQGPIVAVDNAIGIHRIIPRVHRLVGVVRNGHIALIHIMQNHRSGMRRALIREGDLRRVGAIGIHIHIIEALTDHLVIVRIDIHGGIHRVVPRIDGLGGIVRNGRTIFIHVMKNDRSGHHRMAIDKGDLRGVRSVGVHIHITRGGTRHLVFFGAERRIGVHRAVARIQGLIGIRSNLQIIFIHIMDGYRGRPGHTHISKGDLCGIGPVGIHNHIHTGGAVQRIIPGIDGGVGVHRIVARVHRLIGIISDGRPVFIHIMDDDRGRLRRRFRGDGFLRGQRLLRGDRSEGVRGHLLIRKVQEIQARHVAIGVKGHDLDGLVKKQIVPGVLHKLQHRIAARLKKSIVAGHILDLQRQPVQGGIRRQRQPIPVGKAVIGNGQSGIADLRALPAFPLHCDHQILWRQRGSQAGQGQQRQEQGGQNRHAAAGEDTNTFHKNDASFGIHRKNTVYFNCITVF